MKGENKMNDLIFYIHLKKEKLHQLLSKKKQSISFYKRLNLWLKYIFCNQVSGYLSEYLLLQGIIKIYDEFERFFQGDLKFKNEKLKKLLVDFENKNTKQMKNFISEMRKIFTIEELKKDA